MRIKFKLLYAVLVVLVLMITTIGATYAYWAASASSMENSVNTSSTIYSISMQINPLYPKFEALSDFSVIPMNDMDALKALKNECFDKYDRGACYAYSIYVYDWNKDLDFISGYMDVTVNNMANLSYMMLRVSDNFDDNSCVTLELDGANGDNTNSKNYCIVKEATAVGDGVGLSLGDSYDVIGTESTEFILLLWLSNLKESQNDYDIGEFNAIVTMQAGNGGEIKGSISNSLVVDNTGSDN